MKKKTFRANASEINKTPTHVRYIFVADIMGTITTCMTYQTLAKLSSPVRLRVVDLLKESVIFLDDSKLDEIREQWRNNYFNWYWDISESYRVVQ